VRERFCACLCFVLALELELVLLSQHVSKDLLNEIELN
jgi:hypothetical protein